MKGKILKSTYYDKYGPNSSFTKAAASVKKITNFFKVRDNAQNKAQGPESENTKSDSSDSNDDITMLLLSWCFSQNFNFTMS